MGLFFVNLILILIILFFNEISNFYAYSEDSCFYFLIVIMNHIQDNIALTVSLAACGTLAFLLYKSMKCKSSGDPGCPESACRQINECIQKDKSKCATIINTSDIEDKVVLCRCWKTKNYPYCDGSHVAHNKEAGDNIGPVIIKKDS